MSMSTWEKPTTISDGGSDQGTVLNRDLVAHGSHQPASAQLVNWRSCIPWNTQVDPIDLAMLVPGGYI